MKAAILPEAPGKLLVDDVTIDRPRDDEVLVRVAACGLCHSDVHVLDGSADFREPRSNESHEFIDERFVETGRFQGHHLFEELQGIGQLLGQVWEQIIHGLVC